MYNVLMMIASLSGQVPDSVGSPPTSVVSAPAVADTLSQQGIQVTGKKRQSGGRVVDASVGKVAAPLHETPRAVTVLTADELRDRNARTIAQTLSMVPGVFTNGSNGSGGYHYKARGYHMPPSVYLVDGFPGVRSGGD